MPLLTWNDIVQKAFEDAMVIQPGEDISSTSYWTNGQDLLNGLLSSLSTEGLTAYQQVRQTFNLQAGIDAYTLGVGGSFSTAKRAQRVTSWRAKYGNILSTGGRVLSMEEFGAQARQPLGESATVPAIVGADTSWPLINVRISPPPNSLAGTIELGYFTPIDQVSNFAAAFSLPDGWPHMLHLQLAVIIYGRYPREGGMPPELAANAQNAKAALVAQNQNGAPSAQ